VTTAEQVGIERDRAAEGGRDGSVEHFNVLVVGAGISGIGVAYRLSHRFGARAVLRHHQGQA
jgi:glycerol-3-phosphate dehydrogenase